MRKPYRSQRTRTLLPIELRDSKNAKAWQEFVDTYEGYLGFVASAPLKGGICLRPHEIDDVIARVWQNVARGIDTYDRSKGKFRSWLKTIARRRASEVLEQRKPDDDALRHHNPPDRGDKGNAGGDQTSTIDTIEDPHPSTQTELEEAEWQAAMYSLTKELIQKGHPGIEEDKFLIVEELRRHHTSVQDICAKYGKSPQDVYNAKHRLDPLFIKYAQQAQDQLENPVFPPVN